MVHHLGPIPFGTSVWKPSAGRGWGRYRVTNVIVGEAFRREREREREREIGERERYGKRGDEEGLKRMVGTHADHTDGFHRCELPFWIPRS